MLLTGAKTLLSLTGFILGLCQKATIIKSFVTGFLFKNGGTVWWFCTRVHAAQSARGKWRNPTNGRAGLARCGVRYVTGQPTR